MDASDRTFSDLLWLVKSWIPWRSEPAHVSRDFWMPDQSCMVCYECDSQFTFFNRRHHCRFCGRIFCGKCTSHWVPTPCSEQGAPTEQWDTIRVCNYCYKQWQQGLTAPVENGVQVASLDLISTSPSTSSFISIKSSGNSDSSSCTFLSLSPFAGLSPYQSVIMEETTEAQSVAGTMSNDHTRGQNWSQSQFGVLQNRTDDEDEELGASHFGSTTSSLSQAPGEAQQVVQDDAEHNITDEVEAPSSLCVAGGVGAEYVDCENNRDLWLPPEPEDEEDEREAVLFEDDDDGVAAGEWGYSRHSSSFGSGGYKSRDKSNEEHKRAMKNVLDGHLRALVAQLLQVENLPAGEENDLESWLEIIRALSWEAATLLKPDMSNGGQMDPGGYVKVKCLASGCRTESMVVKGVVCKKNVAHRRMKSKVEKARLLILGGALEYHRVSNTLSSFDTLLQQEMDHLKMAVAKIEAHRPSILLVEKSVSRFVQEQLLEKDISLVLNIKRPLLERIARCTGGHIVPSIDQLSSQKLGYCDMFHVEKVLEEHGTAGQTGKKHMKTLMYFEGCPKPLGCTILLRGSNGDELKKVKHVLQYGVFAAYHLALETSFLADEGASLPVLPLNSSLTVALPDNPLNVERSISTVPNFTVPENEKTPWPQSVGELQRSNSVPTSDLLKATIASVSENGHTETSRLPACLSPQLPTSSSGEVLQCSSVNEPSLHQASEERDVEFLISLEAKGSEASRLAAEGVCHIANDFEDLNGKIMQSDCCDIDANRNVSNFPSGQLNGEQILEEQPTFKEEFPPSLSDNQSILVSLSSRCVWKKAVCVRSHLFRITYYGNFDKPLGHFLRDHLFDQNYRCQSCDMPTEAHVQCYTHRQGTLTISVQKLQGRLLPGEKDGKIWMWHRCLKCPRPLGFPPATLRVVMSEAAWGLSFGKFLELSFSNHAAASRVASCGHSLHRDCLRFYGYGKMVACFRYASIDVHSVYLPPPKLDFNYESQDWIKKELHEVVARAELLFSEVLNSLRLLVERKSGLHLLNSGMKVPESRSHISSLEEMLQKEKSEFEESLHKILKKEAKKGQPTCDILELNRLGRQLVFQAYLWDHRLVQADILDNKSQADATGLTCSESIQKPLAVDEKLFDITVQTKTGEILGSSCTIDAKPDHSPQHRVHNYHPEVLNQRTDALFNSDPGDQISLSLSIGTKANGVTDILASDVAVHRVLSDGRAPACSSDTRNSVWTGENHPSVGITKNNKLPESLEAGNLSARVSEKSEVEGHGEDLTKSKVSSSSSFFSSKGSDNVGDTGGWLGMSFMSFYRSLNKNFLGSAQKLDTLSEYNPIYISSFRESELQSGARFLLPVGVNDTVVQVFDDEPTSIISYALLSPDYLIQLSDKQERPKDTADSMISIESLDAGNFQLRHSLDEMMLECHKSLGYGDETVLPSTPHGLLPLDSVPCASHARVSFKVDGPLGKVKYTVTCYFAKCFESLRRTCCPSEINFIRSLSRCKKWGAQGGKSNVFFAKSLDDRFIIKQVTKTELESFIKFGARYFKYLSESISPGSPTCLAKILGIYQVTSKHLKGGKESKMDFLVMENLLFRRNVTRLYDLKGSSRSRYNTDSSGSNKVLLDQNLIDAMPTSPIFVGNKAKRLLERAVWNDTAFLSSIDVMDYSLLVGVDEERHELVVGIIDFMRQYTWDKHLETWVKASGILGGAKNASPTVISPEQYKRRFRKAMTAYFLMVPDQWSPPTIIPSKSQTDLCEENNAQNMTHAE